MADEGTAERIAGRVVPAAAVPRATVARLVTDSGVPVQAAALALVAVAGELAEGVPTTRPVVRRALDAAGLTGASRLTVGDAKRCLTRIVASAYRAVLLGRGVIDALDRDESDVERVDVGNEVRW